MTGHPYLFLYENCLDFSISLDKVSRFENPRPGFYVIDRWRVTVSVESRQALPLPPPRQITRVSLTCTTSQSKGEIYILFNSDISQEYGVLYYLECHWYYLEGFHFCFPCHPLKKKDNYSATLCNLQ